MSKTFKILLGAVFAFVFVCVLSWVGKAEAANYTIDRLTVRDLAHFDRNYDGWIGTGSEIYDNNNLVIASDDHVEIWAPQQARFRSDAYWRRNYDGWDGTNSRIFDNNDMHVATDDFFYLDAPVKVIVQNHMDVGGTLQVYGLTVANGPVDLSNAGTVIIPSFTVTGDVDMNGYSVLNINNVDVQGYVENSSGPTVLVDDNVIVQGTLALQDDLWMNGHDILSSNNVTVNNVLDVKSYVLNSTGTFWVNDTFAVSGVADMQNTIWSSSGNVYIGDGMTISGEANLQGNIYNSTGDLVFNDYSDFRNSLYNSTGNFTIADSMTVDNLAYLNGGIDVNGSNFTVSTAGNMVVTGTSDLQDQIWNSVTDLMINDNAIIMGYLDVRGDLFDNGGPLTINDIFVQSGAGNQVTLQGNVDATNGLDVTGAALTVNSNFSAALNGALTVAAGQGLDSTGGFLEIGQSNATAINFSGGYGPGGVTITNSGNLLVDGFGVFDGILRADAGVDTSAFGTPLMLGGTMASLVYLDAMTTLSVGVNTTTVNIDAITTLNIGTSNATIIAIGNAGSATTIYGTLTLPNAASSISGAGSGSGLDADMIDGQHIADFQVVNTGAAPNTDPVYGGMGYPNEVICNYPTGLSSVSSATATAEDLSATGPFIPAVYTAMVLTGIGNVTPGGPGAPCGPLNPGEVHIIITTLPGFAPPGVFAAGSVRINVHVSQ